MYFLNIFWRSTSFGSKCCFAVTSKVHTFYCMRFCATQSGRNPAFNFSLIWGFKNIAYVSMFINTSNCRNYFSIFINSSLSSRTLRISQLPVAHFHHVGPQQPNHPTAVAATCSSACRSRARCRRVEQFLRDPSYNSTTVDIIRSPIA